MALVLSACAAVDPVKPVSAERTSPPITAQAPAPLPEAPPAAAATPPPPLPPAPRVDVRHALEQVRLHLDQGAEEPALAELKRVLEAEPENKAAAGFLRQIREDPKSLYGRVSQPYRVMAGDTLALIAQRALADRDQFYGLARYNGLKVPGDLKVGQLIQVPGSKRLTPAAAPAAAGTATGAGTATAPVREPPAGAGPTPEETKAANEKKLADDRAAIEKKRLADEQAAAAARKRELSGLLGKARAAVKSQDLCGAIKLYDAVLKLDAVQQAAQLERTRAVELHSRLTPKQC